MAKNKNYREFTVQDKCKYFSDRVNDPKLSDGQRKWARIRLNQLCGGKSPKKQASSTSSNYTDGQKYAYGAGIGYGKAKQGKRVDVKDENKDSFRKGLERAKRSR